MLSKPVPTKKAWKAKSKDDYEQYSEGDDSERDDQMERVGQAADEELETLREESQAPESAAPMGAISGGIQIGPFGIGF